MIEIEEISGDPVKDEAVEIVERKGKGHPDSISDGIAEQISQALSKKYREQFGHILHHNTDEVQLVAGSSNPEFGGGEIQEEIYLLLAGRATKEFKGETIPVDEIAVKATEKYVQEEFKVLSPEHFEIKSRIGETSTDLEKVYEENASNDTSFGVGHAPLSKMEKTVRSLTKAIPEEFDEIGEDVKVMGIRKEDGAELTVAAAVISDRVKDLEEYKELMEKVKKFAEKRSSFENLEVNVNTADNYEEKTVYLTETGTSAEMGDDGSVGRGNRLNGLITPSRSMSMEASSGKNPVTHVGKIYNFKANKIAERIHEETDSFAQVKILSQIGQPVEKPQAVHIETDSSQQDLIQKIVSGEVEKADEIQDKAVEGELETF